MNLERLRSALSDLEAPASKLPWAGDRPWRTETHTWEEAGLAVVDLHDLSVRLALRVVEALDDDELLAVCLITGRGKHVGGHSRLRRSVTEALRELAERRGWATWSRGPGRLMVAVDAAQVPTEGPSVLLVLVGALLLVAVFALSPMVGGVVVTAVVCAAVWRWLR